jgi:hypothetical protein
LVRDVAPSTSGSFGRVAAAAGKVYIENFKIQFYLASISCVCRHSHLLNLKDPNAGAIQWPAKNFMTPSRSLIFIYQHFVKFHKNVLSI